VETVKDDARLLQQLAIVSQSCAQSVHNRVKARSFKPVKLVVLQINVVDYLGNLTQPFVTIQPESFEHCFERAILTMMGEFSAIHVKGERAFYGLALSNKVKARALIDELFD